MFATSKMLAKSIDGHLRYSDFMRLSGDNNSGQAEDDNFRIDRTFMTSAYKVNSWIRAIVDRTVDRFDQVDLFPMPLASREDVKSGSYPDNIKRQMENVMNFLTNPNSDLESFSSLKRKVITDVLIYDEAGIQIVKGETVAKNTVPYQLYANVTGEELFVNSNPNGTLKKSKTYVQSRGGQVIATWDKYNMMNFIKNVRAGYTQGYSPIESIADAIMGDLDAMNYNTSFFTNNARPNIAILFSDLGFGPGQTALERAEKWYNSKVKGKPHTPLFMGTQKGKIEIKEMQISNKDMEFASWQLMLLSRIMSTYGMQPMVLGVLTDTTGKLNSEVQTEQYKRNCIIPLVNMFCNIFNSVFIWPEDNLNTKSIYLTSSNLDIDDEKKQSEIWETFLNTGVITINQVRNELQMPPVDWGDEPFVPLNFAPLSVLREIQESKIEANRKAAMNQAAGDNQLKVGDDPKKKVLPKKAVTKKEFEMMSGLESIEPGLVIDAATNLLEKREKQLGHTTVLMNPHGPHDFVRSFDLSWKNIMKSR